MTGPMENQQPQRSTEQTQKPIWGWMFLLYLVCTAFSYLCLEPHRAPEAMGRALSQVGIPLIFVGILSLFARVFAKGPLSRRLFLALFAPIFLFLFAAAWMGTEMQLKRRVDRARSSAGIRENYVFSPEGSEYSVVFPASPKLSDLSIEVSMIAERAELILIEHDSFLRAESVRFPKNRQLEFTRPHVEEAIREYAKYNGLVYTEYSYEESALGKIASARGYKSLQDENGRDIKVTYRIVTNQSIKD